MAMRIYESTKEYYDQCWRRKGLLSSAFYPIECGGLSEYIATMAAAICNEYNRHQKCWLVDNALKTRKIYSWDYIAISNAYNRLFGKDLRPFNSSEHGCYSLDDKLYYELLKFYESNVSGIAVNEKTRMSTEKEGKGIQDIEIEQNEIGKYKETIQLLQAKIDDLSLQIEEKHKYLDKLIEEEKRIIQQTNDEAETIRSSIVHAIAREQSNADFTEIQSKDNLKETVEEKTRVFENTLRELLESYRDNIQSMLYSFRTDLYSVDYAQICDAYQRIYIFATSTLEKRIKNYDLKQDYYSLIEQEIREIQGLLIKRIARIERGLESMGLTIIRPIEGDIYNCNEHATENIEDDGTLEAIIKLCVCPGVKYLNQVICRANVIVGID